MESSLKILDLYTHNALDLQQIQRQHHARIVKLCDLVLQIIEKDIHIHI